MTEPGPEEIPLGECEYWNGERWVLTHYWGWDVDLKSVEWVDVRIPDAGHPTKGVREWVPADRVRPVTER